MNTHTGLSVVIKQWFVHGLCGGEQTYVHCVYIEGNIRTVNLLQLNSGWIVQYFILTDSKAVN